nr:MAG TPA: hypothetical protein [Caudoviricetes sp.]
MRGPGLRDPQTLGKPALICARGTGTLRQSKRGLGG